jgi:outer membrane immunogenic protein
VVKRNNPFIEPSPAEAVILAHTGLDAAERRRVRGEQGRRGRADVAGQHQFAEMTACAPLGKLRSLQGKRLFGKPVMQVTEGLGCADLEVEPLRCPAGSKTGFPGHEARPMNRMLLLAVLVGSAFFASRSALAAEFSWTGFYIGANAGYGFSQTSASAAPGDPNTDRQVFGQPVVPPLAASFDDRGWLAGATAGFNWQLAPRWVAGIEADISAADVKGGGTTPSPFFAGQSSGTFSVAQSLDWFGTLRGRLGYLPTSNLLIYATGGLAFGRVNSSANFTLDPGQSNSIGLLGYGFGCGGIYGSSTCFAGGSARTSAGWTAGAGAEYLVTTNVSFRLEYLHVNLGRDCWELPAVNFFGLKPSLLNASTDAAFNIVRFGINYRF